MMQMFNTPVEAAVCIQDFLFDRDEALPDDVREKLRALVAPGSSPVDAIVYGAELLYARRDELGPEAKELGAALALVAEPFHDLRVDKRAMNIAYALMRDAKVKAPVGIKYPVAKDDPQPKAQFVRSEPLSEVGRKEK